MRRVLPILAVLVVSATGTLLAAAPGSATSPVSPSDGLVVQYAMDPPSTTSVLVDSASGLDGRVVSAGAAPRFVPGLRGYERALELVGQQHQYVAVPLSPLLDVDRFTLSAWVRYTGVPNDKTNGRWEVLEKPDAYWMNVRTDGRVRAGGFFGGCLSANWRYLDSTRAIPTYTWTHVAATYNGTWLRLYVNGVAAGAKQVTGRTCASDEPLAVGAKIYVGKGILEAYWDGRLDEVRVYNRALGDYGLRQLATRP